MKSKQMSLVVYLMVAISLLISPLQAEESSNKAYWTDLLKKKINELNLSVGESKTVRLVAEIPEKEILKAYSMVINFDESIMSCKVVASQNSSIKPKMISSKVDGTIAVNSFDVTGYSGKSISIVDVTITGLKKGSYPCNLIITAFGESADKQFIPTTNNLFINIK
jgi:hypothetical protein